MLKAMYMKKASTEANAQFLSVIKDKDLQISLKDAEITRLLGLGDSMMASYQAQLTAATQQIQQLQHQLSAVSQQQQQQQQQIVAAAPQSLMGVAAAGQQGEQAVQARRKQQLTDMSCTSIMKGVIKGDSQERAEAEQVEGMGAFASWTE